MSDAGFHGVPRDIAPYLHTLETWYIYVSFWIDGLVIKRVCESTLELYIVIGRAFVRRTRLLDGRN